MSSKSSSFEAYLLAALKEGRWKPGVRLPTTAELAAESGTNLREVQRALATLAARGLLDRKPRAGTFVRENPAPLTIGLLTGWNLKLERHVWPRRFAHELEHALRGLGYRMHLFDNLYAGLVNDSAQWHLAMERLSEEMATVAPAGFVGLQFHLSRLSTLYPRWQRPTVLCSRREYGAEVWFDRVRFYHDALKWLAARGRRRVVLIRRGALLEHYPEEDEAFWQATRNGRFLQASIREVYIREQEASSDFEPLAAGLVESLVAEWKRAKRPQTPDALLVTDDVMMRGVATALLRHGIRVPEDLSLVTLATEGITHHYGLPVARYEFPTGTLARELAHRLHLKICKQPQPGQPTVISGTMVEPDAASFIPSPAPLSSFPL